MPDENTATAGETTDTTASTTTDTKAFEPITSQDDLNRIIQKRVERERAGFSDYDELKAKAAKLDQIDEASKTEAQIATEKLAAAEQRAADLEVKATRAEVAAAKGVPAELLSGTTQAELEAAADALIAFRGEQKQTPSSTAIGRVNGSTTVAATPGDLFAEHIKNQLGH